MAYARIQHAGGAVVTTLNGAITSGDTSCSIVSATGWPDGATGPFYLVIDAGLATEEKILATTRTTTTLNTLTRGVDGTSAAAHASGASVQHCFTAVEADEANVAVNKTIGAVTTKGDLIAATASQTLNRLAAGANNTLLHADSGASTGLSYSKLATGDITAGAVDAAALGTDAVTTAKILNANVTAAKLATDSVETAKITDLNVTYAKLAAVLEPIQVCTSGTRPTPSVGMQIYETDTGNFLQYHGATTGWQPPWNSDWGLVTPTTGANPRSVSGAQGSISSETDVTGSEMTFTAVANRIYKHTVRAIVAHTVTESAMILRITDGAGTELDRAANHTAATGSNDTLGWTWYETGLTAGSKTRKVTAQAASGSMSIQSDDADFQYAIEDAGPNGLPS